MADMPAQQSYPSPNQAQVASGGGGPFYSQHNGATQAQEEVPTDPALQLATAMARNEHPATSAPPPESMMAQVHTPGHHPSPHPQMPTASMMPNGLPMPQDYDMTPGSDSSRKRTKVSRACDECRRKKIKCNADEGENGPQACHACQRTGAQCQFSRQPMKRGPSKGYIKELADRLRDLEQHVGPQYQQQQPDLGYGHTDFGADGMAQLQNYSPPAMQGPRAGQKRTHSVSEGAQDPFGTVAHRPGSSWGMSEADKMMDTTGSQHMLGRYASQQSLNAQTSWNRRQSNNFEQNAAAALIEWDDDLVNDWYNLFSQSLPLLPLSKDRLRNYLINCSVTLRNAFMAALNCAVRSHPSSNLYPDDQGQRRSQNAEQLIAAAGFEDLSTQNLSGTIVRVQIYLLMALHADNYGPRMTRGQVGGMPKSHWISIASDLITKAKLYELSPAEYTQFLNDPDDEAVIGRRIFWVLFIMERWDAISTGAQLLPLENLTLLTAEDKQRLGNPTYQLARLSFVAGHLVSAIKTYDNPNFDMANPSANSVAIMTAMRNLVNGELERFREGVEDKQDSYSQLYQLCYWHLRLLIGRTPPLVVPLSLLESAMRITSLLNNNQSYPHSPFHHHFAAHAALTLSELLELDETRQRAHEGFMELDEAIESHRALAVRDGSAAWDSALREFMGRKKASLHNPSAASATGLQHLANAAINEREGNSERPGTRGGEGQTNGNEDAKPAGSNAALIAAAVAAAAAAGQANNDSSVQDATSAAQAAQATAQAASAHLQLGRSIGGGIESYDPTLVARNGYLVVLAHEAVGGSR